MADSAIKKALRKMRRKKERRLCLKEGLREMGKATKKESHCSELKISASTWPQVPGQGTKPN